MDLFNNDILLKEVIDLRENNRHCCFVLVGYDIAIIPTRFLSEESFGQLVLLGYDVTTFRPVTYQRSSLLRPSMEVSSCG